MLFFLGLMTGGTAGFFFALLAVAAGRDAAVRDEQYSNHGLQAAPLVPTNLALEPSNTGRYEIINEAAVSRSRMDLQTGTDD